jgi:hypothetical protein
MTWYRKIGNSRREMKDFGFDIRFSIRFQFILNVIRIRKNKNLPYSASPGSGTQNLKKIRKVNSDWMITIKFLPVSSMP